MSNRELMPEDEDTLARIENIVSEILRALHGEPMYKQVGLFDQFDAFKLDVNVRLLEVATRLTRMEQGDKKWKFGLACFAIGAGVAFGIYMGLSLKDIKNFIH